MRLRRSGMMATDDGVCGYAGLGWGEGNIAACQEGMMNNDRSRGAEGVLEVEMYDDIDICFFMTTMTTMMKMI